MGITWTETGSPGEITWFGVSGSGTLVGRKWTETGSPVCWTWFEVGRILETMFSHKAFQYQCTKVKEKEQKRGGKWIFLCFLGILDQEIILPNISIYYLVGF